MKKNLLTLILLTLSILSSAQKKANYKDLGNITKAKLAEIKLNSEIIPDLLKENKPFEIEITGKSGEVLTQIKSTRNEISPEEKTFFENINVGTKLYFDVIYIEATGTRGVTHTFFLKVKK